MSARRSICSTVTRHLVLNFSSTFLIFGDHFGGNGDLPLDLLHYINYNVVGLFHLSVTLFGQVLAVFGIRVFFLLLLTFLKVWTVAIL